MSRIDEIIGDCPHRNWDGRYCNLLTVESITKDGAKKYTFHLCRKLSGGKCPFGKGGDETLLF